MVDHILLLVWHAVLVSVFFAYLWRSEARARRRLFLKTLLIMVLGGVACGWLMYFVP